jgi:hypothetical protein
MLYVVPNWLRDEIHRRLDAQFALVPDAEKDREALYSSLLSFFNEHGVLPDFSLVRAESSEAIGRA